FISNPIVNNEMLVRTSGSAVQFSDTASGNNAYQRLFDNPIDTMDGSFWFASHMQAKGSYGGNIGNVALVDTTGGSSLQLILGKRFGNGNIFATGDGTNGAQNTGALFTQAGGAWVVAHMDWVADSSRWELDVWVNPSIDSIPTENTAGIVNKRYAASNYNATLIRTGGAQGLDWSVDDLYFGRNFSDVIPDDLTPVAAAPPGFSEKFDYDAGTELIGANGGTGFAGPYQLVADTTATIAEGGMTNFYLLKETSSNKLAVRAEDNIRAFRALEGTYGDSGREYWMGWFYDANGSGGNVAHLVLGDTATFATDAGTMLQVGKLFNGRLGVVGTGPMNGVSSDTVNFIVANIVTNGAPGGDKIYFWINPGLDVAPSRDTANLVATKDLANWNCIGFKVAGDPGVAPEWDDISLAYSFKDIVPGDLMDVAPPDAPKVGFDIFDYTASEDLDGQDGGEGWGGAWSKVKGTASIADGSVDSDRVTAEGNSVSITQSADSVFYLRPLFNPFSSGEVWMSFLLDVEAKDIGNNAQVTLHSADGAQLFGLGGVAGISKFGLVYADQQLTDDDIDVTANNWVVVRLDMDGTDAADKMRVWINPPADAIPADDASVFDVDDIDLNDGVSILALMANGAQSTTMNFDAFRIGFSYRDISNKFGSDDPDLLLYEPFNYDIDANIAGAGGVNAFWDGPWVDAGNIDENLATIDESSLEISGYESLGNKAKLEYKVADTQIRMERDMAFPFEDDGRTYWFSFLQFSEETTAFDNIGNVNFRRSDVANAGGHIMAFGRVFGNGKIGVVTPQTNNARPTETDDVGLNWCVSKLITTGDDEPDSVFFWINPDPMSEPDTADAALFFRTTQLNNGFDIIRMRNEGAGANQVPYTTLFDEIKLATKFESASFISNTIEPFAGDPFALKAYPNPAQEFINVEYNLTSRGRTIVELYNINGARIRTLHDAEQYEGNQRLQFDLHQVQNGIYFLRIVQNGKATTRKLIVYRY
ncbi:MAG: T9SS type A sorting domain-containing protein, partial [Bacteroidota bacterium]